MNYVTTIFYNIFIVLRCFVDSPYFNYSSGIILSTLFIKWSELNKIKSTYFFLECAITDLSFVHFGRRTSPVGQRPPAMISNLHGPDSCATYIQQLPATLSVHSKKKIAVAFG